MAVRLSAEPNRMELLEQAYGKSHSSVYRLDRDCGLVAGRRPGRHVCGLKEDQHENESARVRSENEISAHHRASGVYAYLDSSYGVVDGRAGEVTDHHGLQLYRTR